MSIVTILTVVGLSAIASGFPDGAPVDACVKPRPNQPYHGQARPQPLSTSPYQLIASSDRYGPGSQITGELYLSAFFFFCLHNIILKYNELALSYSFSYLKVDSCASRKFLAQTTKSYNCMGRTDCYRKVKIRISAQAWV